jgi:hypothetical protein
MSAVQKIQSRKPLTTLELFDVEKHPNKAILLEINGALSIQVLVA